MGCCSSKSSVDAVADKSQRNYGIQSKSNQNISIFKKPNDFTIVCTEYEECGKEVEILFMGTEKCGKTTLWNNFEINYRENYYDNYKLDKIQDIRKYLLKAVNALLENIKSNKLEINNINFQIPDENNISPEFRYNIISIWRDPSVQDFFHNDQYDFFNNESFFLDNIARIAEKDYIPNNEDILKCYFDTTETLTSKFIINGTIKTKLIDTSAKESPIPYYENYFKDIQFLVFVVSLPDFDQNSYYDSINLFRQIMNSSVFSKKQVFLVLNKTDVFEQKMNNFPNRFNKFFPDFKGKVDDINACISYVKDIFMNEVPHDRNTKTEWVEVVQTCAIDLKNAQNLFQTIAKRVCGIPKENKEEEDVESSKRNENANIGDDEGNKKIQEEIEKKRNEEQKQKEVEKKLKEKEEDIQDDQDTNKKSKNNHHNRCKRQNQQPNEQTESNKKLDKHNQNKEPESSLSENYSQNSNSKKRTRPFKYIDAVPDREKADDEISVYEYASQYITDGYSYTEYYTSSYY